ncbi:MAG: P-II family nitrogen regulator [Candidatus Omnitrophica bacterium]|nr:P-II family nitrogen regulator [Candidatus Omnitrophota bacterium]MBI2105001.1 P-II family nitrogen regulator [Candidatus Omnitrophota bacterium]
MKKIEAIVRPEKVDDVRKSLEKAGYPGMTLSEVEGHGKQKGVTRQWRGESYKVDLLPKAKIEVIVSDKDAGRITSAIASAAKTGSVGDGKIFISQVEDAVRIRTGDRGEEAL